MSTNRKNEVLRHFQAPDQAANQTHAFLTVEKTAPISPAAIVPCIFVACAPSCIISQVVADPLCRLSPSDTQAVVVHSWSVFPALSYVTHSFNCAMMFICVFSNGLTTEAPWPCLNHITNTSPSDSKATLATRKSEEPQLFLEKHTHRYQN